ncbi:MAG TPA: hypothetical protein VEW28_07590 [Candidatus Kapabacteria bacterium]|nr:hypothetical protein [Candidatus Kapabacteria bacterium]
MKKIFLPILFVVVCTSGAFAQNAASPLRSSANTPNAWVKAMSEQKPVAATPVTTTNTLSADAARNWINTAKANAQTTVILTEHPVNATDAQKAMLGWMQYNNSAKINTQPNENKK